jgi:hypothetical protein
MKAATLWLVVGLWLPAAAAPALAWGPEAHVMVGAMAEAHLTPQALAKVRALLAQDKDVSGKPQPHAHLDEVATWADKWRPLHPETGPWHYVDIPLDAKTYDEARDCHQGKDAKESNCVVVKLAQFVRTLADTSKSDEARLEALKYVVHLVGDITQPMHAETKYSPDGREDLGGNNVKVEYYGQATNLHFVWDQSIPEKHHGWAWALPPDYEIDREAARFAATIMDARLAPADRKRWAESGTLASIDARVIAWANEAHAIAPAAYANMPVYKPGATEDGYQTWAWPIVELQLQKASVRLATILNEALR